jgi:luciferase family oxidoreductase group 1
LTRDLLLNVLDQSPVRQGGTAADALRESVELAQAVEALGYFRYWVAEHHSTANFAGTAPEILIGQIAAHTSSIHVGSGGVMLSHYSALKVAETFRILAAFYPRRIDLGIGRAPGSDPATAVALAHPRPQADLNEFPRQVTDLIGFLGDRLAEEHPFAGIAAQPGPPPAYVPEVWLLGSSDYSARLAATLGLPFAFADFFGSSGDFGPRVAELYRRQYQPSEDFPEPRVNVAVHVVCAPSADEARFIASSAKLRLVHARTGGPRVPLPPPEDAAPQLLDPRVAAFSERFSRHFIDGDPEHVRARLIEIVERYQADELSITTNCFSFADRLRSFNLVAQTMIAPKPSVAASN